VAEEVVECAILLEEDDDVLDARRLSGAHALRRCEQRQHRMRNAQIGYRGSPEQARSSQLRIFTLHTGRSSTSQMA
jgi:hypothetical protein